MTSSARHSPTLPEACSCRNAYAERFTPRPGVATGGRACLIYPPAPGYPRRGCFLLTDVEGSTRLWEQHPEAMRHAMDRHLGLLRHAVSTHAGQVFRAGRHRRRAADSGGAHRRTWRRGGTAAGADGTAHWFGRLLGAGRGGQAPLSQATTDLAYDAPGRRYRGAARADRDAGGPLRCAPEWSARWSGLSKRWARRPRGLRNRR